MAVPNVPVEHPDISTRGQRPKTAEQGRDEYPLLTLPEQRRSRQSLQAPSSLQVERSSGNYSDKGSVKLPENRKSGQQREQRQAPPQRREESPVIAESSRAAEARARARAILESAMPANEENGHAAPSPIPPAFLSQDPMRDVEAGRTLQKLKRSTSRASLPGTPRTRTPTVPRTADTTAGAEQPRPDTALDDGGDEIPWGPQHPCFPHMNPHVPLNSQEYADTRIIRVRRDWMLVGDLAPTFQNLYPEVLAAHISEDEFRRVVQYVNGQLVAAFSPWSVRAWVDMMIGIATLWLWDDLGLPGVKGRLKKLEAWVESWNRAHVQDGVRIIPLRRTAYMSVSSLLLILSASDFLLIGDDSSTSKFRTLTSASSRVWAHQDRVRTSGQLKPTTDLILSTYPLYTETGSSTCHKESLWRRGRIRSFDNFC